MEFDEYQDIARSTAIYPNRGTSLIYPAFGLCGESGEVAEKIKKVLRDHSGVFSPETKQAVAKELGDVLWYVALIADELGYSLQTIAKMNVEKINSRKRQGKISGSGDNREEESDV